MTTLRVRATGNGRIVDSAQLKRARLVDADLMWRLFLPTTTLTNVVADLYVAAEALDRDARIVILVPNSLRNPSLNLMLVGAGFEIVCAQRLVRGWLPLAAEFGSNYDVVVTIGGESAEARAAVEKVLRSKYVCVGDGPELASGRLAERVAPPTWRVPKLVGGAALLFVLALLGFTFILWMLHEGILDDGVTKAKTARIQAGMTRAEVEAILEGPPDAQAGPPDGSLAEDQERLSWSGPGGTVEVVL